MTDRYENIRRALAMGPTPGPWQLSIETPTIIKQDLSSIGLSRGGVLIGSACGHESSGCYPTREQAIANARLIAACDPDTIRALLAERDALAAALEAAHMCLRYAVRVYVLSDEIEWSEAEIDEAVERIIGYAKKEAGRG